MAFRFDCHQLKDVEKISRQPSDITTIEKERDRERERKKKKNKKKRTTQQN